MYINTGVWRINCMLAELWVAGTDFYFMEKCKQFRRGKKLRENTYVLWSKKKTASTLLTKLEKQVQLIWASLLPGPPPRKRVKGFSAGWSRAWEERYQLDGKETRLTVQTAVQLLPILCGFLWQLVLDIAGQFGCFSTEIFMVLWEKKATSLPYFPSLLIFFFFCNCASLFIWNTEDRFLWRSDPYGVTMGSEGF